MDLALDIVSRVYRRAAPPAPHLAAGDLPAWDLPISHAHLLQTALSERRTLSSGPHGESKFAASPRTPQAGPFRPLPLSCGAAAPGGPSPPAPPSSPRRGLSRRGNGGIHPLRRLAARHRHRSATAGQGGGGPVVLTLTLFGSETTGGERRMGSPAFHPPSNTTLEMWEFQLGGRHNDSTIFLRFGNSRAGGREAGHGILRWGWVADGRDRGCL